MLNPSTPYLTNQLFANQTKTIDLLNLVATQAYKISICFFNTTHIIDFFTFTAMNLLHRIKDITSSLLSPAETIPAEALAKYPLRAYNAARHGQRHTALCYAPATNMYFSQTGEVGVCCHNMEFSAGRYPAQTLKEIWNSDAAKAMREDMRQYKLGKGCEICEADLVTGSFEEVRARHFDHIPRRTDYPTQMEFLLTNTCNLECVMCKGEFSSSIRQNREKLPPIQNVYDDAFLEQLKEFIPYLHETRFSGSGEAFLIDVNYKIWELIIALNPKCKIMVQTNSTVLNSKIKDLLEKGNFHIGVSLDSLKKEVFEAIRPGAKFERVMENIHYFNAYCQRNKRKFNISTCVMRQNWEELPAFVKFSNKLGAIQNFHKVWFPREHALFNLPEAELLSIHTYLAPHNFPTQTLLQKMNNNHYAYFVDTVQRWYKDAHLGLTPTDEIVKDEAALSLPDIELKPYLFKKIDVCFVSKSHSPRIKNSMPNEELKLKINELICALDSEKTAATALRQMCVVDTLDLISALNNHTTSELLAMANDF